MQVFNQLITPRMGGISHFNFGHLGKSLTLVRQLSLFSNCYRSAAIKSLQQRGYCSMRPSARVVESVALVKGSMQGQTPILAIFG